MGPEPEGAELEQMGFGWTNSYGTGKGSDTITSGLEGAWTTNPTQWDVEYWQNLKNFSWEKYVGPGGHWQWRVQGGPTPLAPAPVGSRSW